MTLGCALGFLIAAFAGALVGICYGSRKEAENWRGSAEGGKRRISRGKLYTVKQEEWSPLDD
jgi:hypothetical protein